ncbi:MAG: hypothetical protein U5J98_03960 [Halobacteriales archaeon]|nr:hypothetical protein [Halobacteriales archaeon]
MPFPVRYYCPRCETVATLQRSGYLADKSVTPYPLEGWTYAEVGGAYDAADGVRIVCGADDEGIAFDGAGCGEPYYLNFVRFEAGREVEPAPESERVELAHPHRPDTPRTPGGPGR